MKRTLGLLVFAAVALTPAVPAAAAFPGNNGRVAFMRFGVVNNLGEIHSVQPDGSGDRDLTGTPLIEDRDPAWSADGKRIAFRRELTGGGSFLAVLTLKGLSLDPLTPPVAGQYEDFPDFSPDGQNVVFVRGSAIYTLKGLLVAAPVTDSHHTMPAWSPNGKKIAYVHLDDDESWGNIYTINADGTANTQITFGPATDEVPRWQPV